MGFSMKRRDMRMLTEQAKQERRAVSTALRERLSAGAMERCRDRGRMLAMHVSGGDLAARCTTQDVTCDNDLLCFLSAFRDATVELRHVSDEEETGLDGVHLRCVDAPIRYLGCHMAPTSAARCGAGETGTGLPATDGHSAQPPLERALPTLFAGIVQEDAVAEVVKMLGCGLHGALGARRSLVSTVTQTTLEVIAALAQSEQDEVGLRVIRGLLEPPVHLCRALLCILGVCFREGGAKAGCDTSVSQTLLLCVRTATAVLDTRQSSLHASSPACGPSEMKQLPFFEAQVELIEWLFKIMECMQVNAVEDNASAALSSLTAAAVFGLTCVRFDAVLPTCSPNGAVYISAELQRRVDLLTWVIGVADSASERDVCRLLAQYVVRVTPKQGTVIPVAACAAVRDKLIAAHTRLPPVVAFFDAVFSSAPHVLALRTQAPDVLRQVLVSFAYLITHLTQKSKAAGAHGASCAKADACFAIREGIASAVCKLVLRGCETQPQNIVQELINAGIIPPLLRSMDSDQLPVRRLVGLCVAGMACGRSTPAQLRHLIAQGALDRLACFFADIARPEAPHSTANLHLAASLAEGLLCMLHVLPPVEASAHSRFIAQTGGAACLQAFARGTPGEVPLERHLCHVSTALLTLMNNTCS